MSTLSRPCSTGAQQRTIRGPARSCSSTRTDLTVCCQGDGFDARPEAVVDGVMLGWETPQGWTADGALLVASIDGGRIRTIDTFKGVISGGGIYALVGFDADALLDAADTTRRSTDCSAAP